jgi:DNA-binding NtrC family response regulator
MTQAGQTHQSITENASRTAGCVLIMDDDANLRFICKQALRYAGYEVYTAETVQKTNSLLGAYRFDVFIGDTHLYGRDQGIDLLCKQSARLTKNGTQIIMISCDAQYKSICQEMGANMFIEKPLAVDYLVTVVDHLVSQR